MPTETLCVHVPMSFRKSGGRKLMVTPDGAPWAPRPSVDNALIRALARAFRWQRMLDSGTFGSIDELARAEQLDRAYVSRLLRLTLLAPDIVEAVLNGRQPEAVHLDKLLYGFPAAWADQKQRCPA